MTIPLPPHVASLIQTLRQEIDAHPYHNFEPQDRLRLYTAFGPRTDLVVNAFRSWWAIYTAERVLQLFVEALPEEDSPPQSLQFAHQIMRGEISRTAQEVTDYREMNYHWSGQMWGYVDDDDMELPGNAYYAGTAACHALDEVCRLETDHFIRYVDLTGATLGMTDLFMAGQSGADTASCAAMAFAINETALGIETYEDCNFERLHQFWTWWLTEALEKAWDMATKE